jgi:coproporphyrinogen III oxidase
MEQSSARKIDLKIAKTFFESLQNKILHALEAEDGQLFRRDAWQRDEGGGGLTAVIEEGGIFERGGVNFSHVFGKALPEAATAARAQVAGMPYDAMGVSLVLHPRNPYIPTVHMNVRLFVAHGKDEDIWWFGGGIDLTPYYPFHEDVIHFHTLCKASLDPFGADLYPRFKQWCDAYFYLKHRKEARGVGGIFFDDLNTPDFETAFALTKSVGENFAPAYLPIVQKRKNLAYGDKERDFQAFRHGRYVEFNLIYDRGTVFGLQSGGRAESILMSLPRTAAWRYDWKPKENSPEAKLNDYLVARDWITTMK